MAHKQQAVFVLNLTNAYDVDVFDDPESDEPIQTPHLSLDNLNFEELEVQNGMPQQQIECVGFPKHPQMKQILDYNLLNTTEDSYYTDMVTLSEYSNLFVMTQELLLIQVKLRCGDSGWIATESKNIFDLKSQLQLKDNNITANALFSCPKMHLHCLIITPYGGFWLSKFADFDSNLMPIEPSPEPVIQKRKAVLKLSTFGELLAVASGEEGVDLYTYEQDVKNVYNKDIKYIMTITKTIFKEQMINIIGVKIENKKLYCLDQTLGLYIFNITEITNPKLLMDIQISRTVAFEVYENTFLIVAQTPNYIEYILEIFIDLRDKTYYVNRVYVDDFTFRDLSIDPNYAFLIGEEAHLIIKHSIYNGFIKNNSEIVYKFYEKQLVKFDLYSQTVESAESRYKETFYYVGLARQQIHVWKFVDYHAFLLCSFDKRSEHTVFVKFNSTSCSEADRESLFQQCQAKQKVHIQVSGPLFESDALTILILSLIVSGILLLIICCFVCLRWRRLLRELEAKRYQISEMQKYVRLDEVEQNQI